MPITPLFPLLLLACGDPDPDPSTDTPVPSGPSVTAGPVVALPVSTALRLVDILTVSTDVPTAATVLLEGGDSRRQITFPGEATDHVLPLLGLVAETSYLATVTLSTADGSVTADPVAFSSGGTFAPAPDRELLVGDPARSEPGYTMYPAEAPDTGIVVLEAVDALGRVVWQYQPPLAGAMSAVQFHPDDGTVSALVGGRFVRRFDLADLGHVSWAPVADVLADEIPVDVPGFHHEAAFEPDGSFWSVHKQNFAVDDYPLDPFDLSVTGPAVLDADVVVHIGVDGAVLGSWLLTDYLDPHRIGFDATDEVAGGDLAWSHVNAVVPLGDADQTFLASSRHQDAVVKIRGSTNEALWILANHDGWAPEYLPLLLDPVGTPFLWSIHQHAPAFDAEGRIVMFDNGNWGHGNPYMTSPPGIEYSRVVRYDVDEVARTVRESFAFVADEDVDPLSCQAVGNADPLPVTGNILGTFAYVKQEGGVPNVEVGLGAQSVRIIEVDPDDGAVVWDLRLNGPATVSALGWQVDRAIRVPSLYASDVVVQVLE